MFRSFGPRPVGSVAASPNAGGRRSVQTVLMTAVVVIATVIGTVAVAPGFVHQARAATVVSSDVTSRPDQTSAALTARLEGHRVEVTDDETASSTTWVNPNGTLTTDQATGPIRVAQASGGWAPLNLNLGQNMDGSYSPIAVPSPVTFSGGGGTTAATFSDGGGSKVGVHWASTLPTPTVKGGVATYQIDSNTKLVLTSTALGLNAYIVLAAAPTTAPTFKLPLSLTGLAATDADGNLTLSSTSSGKTVAVARQFTMWDAQTDAGGDPSNVTAVGQSLAKDDAGDPEIDLAPSMQFLTSPTTQYPVTIDPSIGSLGRLYDTYVDSSNPSSTFWTDYRLRDGSPDGTEKFRSMLNFNTSALSGTDVTSATLTLHDYYAATCTAKTTNVYPLTGAFTGSGATWTGQPGVNTSSSYSGSASFSHGDPTDGCSSANQNIDLTNMVAGWASGAITNYGMELRASSETDANSEKRFCSMDPDSSLTYCNTSATEPVLSATYNSYPATASSLAILPSLTATNGNLVTTTRTPSLQAAVADPDGGTLAVDVQIYNSTGSTLIWSGSHSGVTAGAKATVAVPSGTLSTGTAYEWRARGYDGTDYSKSWTSLQTFHVNTGLPATAALSCATFTSGTWTNANPSGVNCTASDTTDGDLAGFYYAFDNPDPATVATASGTSATITMPTGSKALTDGWHTLYVQTYDTAYNRAATVAQYSFGVGVGGLSSPDDGDTTQQAVTLTTAAASAETGVTFNYRQGTTGTWITVPTGDVTIPGTSTNPTWPQSISGGVSSALDWNVGQTVSNAGGTDGPVQLEACFSHGGTQDGCSTTETLTLARTAFGDSQSITDLGPGSLSLLTGDLDVSASDVDVASAGDDLTLGRDLTTLGPSTTDIGATGIFGPAWTADLPAPGDGYATDTLVTNVTNGDATLTDPDGAILVYETTSSGYPYTFKGVGTANDGSVLTMSSSTAASILESDGTTTTWTRSTGSGPWQLVSVNEPGAADTTSYTYNGSGQVSQVLAPVPSGVTCSSPTTTKGCRTLTLTYATATTATGTSPSQWGDYYDSTNAVGRLKSVQFTAWDAVSAAMKTVTVADYAYDNTGMLRGEWDPRISPVLETTYSYGSTCSGSGATALQLCSVTPPGLNGDTINYDTAGRVASVKWTDPANGTATEAVAYGVPITTGSGGPIDMSATATDSWDQATDLPYTGTEVFPADHVPATGSHGDYAPTSSDYPYGSITYMDVDGQDVDDASYGAGAWQISATQYDANGNTIWQLTPNDLSQALTPTADTDPLVANMPTSAERAAALATTNVYASNGYDLTDAYGPTHQVTLDNGALAGQVVDAQDHTHYVYNQGAPSGTYDLVTETDDSPYFAQSGSSAPADYTPDTRTTLTGYNPIDGSSNTGPTSGWTLGEPTSTTTVMPGSGNNITTGTEYDNDGNVSESVMPKATSPGTDAYTTDTGYYTAGTNSMYPACSNHPEWAGLVCQTGPAVQPTSGPPVPTTVTTYDMYDKPLTITATSGAMTRTTTITYDTADRFSTSAANDTTSGVPSIPTTTTSYDSSTGLPTTVTSAAGTITTGYNAIGEITSYQAPASTGTNTTTTTYNIDGQINTVNDGKGTTSYTYNGTDSLGRAEHRGLPTSETTGAVSDIFSAAYDGDGNLVSETYPNGLIASTHYDDVDSATDLSYAMGSTRWLDFTQQQNEFGQVTSEASSESSQQFTYDNDRRVTQVADSGDETCVTRVYSSSAQPYDLDSNRTGYASYPADSANNCSTSTTPTASETYTHDQADRVTNSGYSYDNMGRTLTVPAADTNDTQPSPSALTMTYFADDMVHTQTQDGVTNTYSLDPSERILGQINSATGITATNIYADGSDSPAWLSNSDGTWTRNITDLAGNLAATETANNTNDVTLQLVNLHDDVVATAQDLSSDSGTASYFETTEFGIPRSTNTTTPAMYGYLGGKERSSAALGGIVLMGQRLYNPAVGRFLTIDPVVGGSANSYDYADQDPINGSDPSGRSTPRPDTGRDWKRFKSKKSAMRAAKANGFKSAEEAKDWIRGTSRHHDDWVLVHYKGKLDDLAAMKVRGGSTGEVVVATAEVLGPAPDGGVGPVQAGGGSGGVGPDSPGGSAPWRPKDDP